MDPTTDAKTRVAASTPPSAPLTARWVIATNGRRAGSSTPPVAGATTTAVWEPWLRTEAEDACGSAGAVAAAWLSTADLALTAPTDSMDWYSECAPKLLKSAALASAGCTTDTSATPLLPTPCSIDEPAPPVLLWRAASMSPVLAASAPSAAAPSAPPK